MIDLLTSPLMIRALLAAAVTGLAAPAVGTYLVQRKLSLMGDGIGHICVTGVALGILTNTSPTLTAVIVAVIGALLIEGIRTSGRASGDVALALLFYGGIAGGLVLVSKAGNGVFALQQYLFGSLTSISDVDVRVSIALAGVVIVLSLALLPQFYAVATDEDYARTTGLRVSLYNVMISVLAAVTVSVAMRTVGLLLVSALMVIPVATAQQFTRGFRATVLAAMGAGVAASVVGVGTSAYVDVPPGATIVLVSLLGFAATWPLGYAIQRRRRARVPFPADEIEAAGSVEHRHQHGPGCGHLGVEHGDHIDYIHDGHRHAPRAAPADPDAAPVGGRYDEH